MDIHELTEMEVACTGSTAIWNRQSPRAERSGQKFPSLSQNKLSPIDNCLQMKNKFPTRESHRGNYSSGQFVSAAVGVQQKRMNSTASLKVMAHTVVSGFRFACFVLLFIFYLYILIYLLSLLL